MKGVLTSKALYQGVTSILESLSRSDLDGAKRLLESLVPAARSDRERGALLAASGIYTSMSKAKERTLHSWDPSKIVRASQSISSSQMADEFDAGYAETLVAYSKLMQKTE